jgi:hypothetical protein
MDGPRVSTQKAELKVFVASPGGVTAERDALVDLVARLNATLGDLLDVTITVRRYEYISGRAGSPQKQIDPWIDSCDVFIAILHRRWGSPPDEEFDSGFAEEFDRALKRWDTDRIPSISVYFKTVDPVSVQDPGPQLAKVLEFRKLIEAKRIAFYSEFEGTADFTLLVQQLLVEEMHKAGRIGATGVGYSPALAGAAREEQVAKDKSSDTGMAAIFSRFATAVAGGEIDGPLDFDRLELFALSASRDDESIPTHLANRLFKRTQPVELSALEGEAWFSTYAGDIGRSRFASERTIPFPSKFGGGESISSISSTMALELLAGGTSNQREGILRILTATVARPRSLWPGGDISEETRNRVIAAWSKIDSSTELASAIIYWMTVGTSRDLRLARILESSTEEKASRLGRILLSLLPKRASADALAEASPSTLLEPSVASRFDDGNPFRSVSTPTLTTIVGRPFLGRNLCSACLVELVRRDAVPPSAIKDAVNEKGHESLFEDEWPIMARHILFDTQASPPLLTTLLEVVSEVEDKSIVRTIFARIAASTPQFRTAAADSIGKIGEQYRDPDAVAAQLIMSSEDEGLVVAIQLIDEAYEPAQSYLAMLKQAGANESTMRYVETNYVYKGLRYLAARATGKTKAKVQRRLRVDRHESAVRQFESAALLSHCFAAEDVEFLIENLRYSSHDRKGEIARFLGEANLATLRRLLDSPTNDVPALALSELDRRGRLPSRKALIVLLGSADSDLRMTALDILCKATSTSSMDEMLKKYWDRSGTYYYNIVCELDHRIAELPKYFPLVAG